MQANIDTTGPSAAEGPAGKPKPVKMAAKLAYRNLFHDRLSLTVTLTGIVFSVVLIAIQCGLYIGSERMIAAMLDQSAGDLWIVPFGTKSFDDPSFLLGHEKYAVLSTPGVKSAEELVVAFAAWRKPKGGMTAVLLIGSDHIGGSLKPWNIVEGSIND
ncbi:MAG: ABC transporter permease, partial [Hyphomicrobium sp.]